MRDYPGVLVTVSHTDISLLNTGVGNGSGTLPLNDNITHTTQERTYVEV
jgi:hypothetical protein